MNAFLDLNFFLYVKQVVISRINQQLNLSARQDLHLDLGDVTDEQEQPSETNFMPSFLSRNDLFRLLIAC